MSAYDLFIKARFKWNISNVRITLGCQKGAKKKAEGTVSNRIRTSREISRICVSNSLTIQVSSKGFCEKGQVLLSKLPQVVNQFVWIIQGREMTASVMHTIKNKTLLMILLNPRLWHD